MRPSAQDAVSFDQPSSLAVASVLALAIMSGAIPSLQPLLLGALASAGQIDLAQIGTAAAGEALAMAFAVLCAGALLKPQRLRLIASFAVLGSVAVNLATPHLAGVQVVFARTAAGGLEGLQMWLYAGLVARIASPTRLAALGTLLMGAGSFAMASLLSTAIIPRFGAGGGYAVIGAIDVLLLSAALGVPANYTALPPSQFGWRPTRPGFLGLLSCLLQFAGIMALWVYISPLGAALSQPQGIVAAAVSVGLLMQIPAGLVAVAWVHRIDRPSTLPLIIGADVAAVGLVAINAGPTVFLAAIASFGFLWFFVLPFQVSMLIDLDPSRRAVILASVAQLAGIGFGPMVASLFIGRGDVRIALIVSAALFTLSGIALVSGRYLRRTEVALPAQAA